MLNPCWSNVMHHFRWNMLECKHAHIELGKMLKIKKFQYWKWQHTGIYYSLAGTYGHVLKKSGWNIEFFKFSETWKSAHNALDKRRKETRECCNGDCAWLEMKYVWYAWVCTCTSIVHTAMYWSAQSSASMLSWIFMSRHFCDFG